MEKIGLLKDFAKLIATRFDLSVFVEKSYEKQTLDKHDTICLSQLKSFVLSGDADFLVNIEKAILSLELSNRANSPEETNSIKTALVQLADAQRAYQLVQDTNAYKETTKAFSTRQREAGLPIDAFREFIKSHTTRLTNRLSSPLPASEKNLLRQRKENLKAAKEAYMVMQRKALTDSRIFLYTFSKKYVMS